MVPHPAFSVSDSAEVCVVRVESPTLGSSASDSGVWENLVQLAQDSPGKPIVLDLSPVGYMNSAALGKLISTNGKIRRLGSTLSLRGLSDVLTEIFRVSRLDRVLVIEG